MCIYDNHMHKTPEINILNQVLTSLKGLSRTLNQVPSVKHPLL